jgi:hypothetical protein
VGARIPVRAEVMLMNVWHGEVPRDLGKVLRWSPGLENRRRGELGDDCPAAAAGTRAPASRQVGLANTRARKLTRC